MHNIASLKLREVDLQNIIKQKLLKVPLDAQ